MNSELTDIEDLLSSRVVMLCGISGSGKTHLAHRLERHGFVRVSADALIWSRYGDEFPSLPATVKQQAFQAVPALLADELRNNLEAGHRVVVDSTLCKRPKRDELRQICRGFGADHILVYLQASFDTLSQRLSRRSGIGPDEQKVSPEQLQGYYANFQAPDPDENAIIIAQ